MRKMPVAPLLVTASATNVTVTTDNVAVNVNVNVTIEQKPGPLFDQLSRSRSKFPRVRSTPTPI